jgi:hypothetical protein
VDVTKGTEVELETDDDGADVEAAKVVLLEGADDERAAEVVVFPNEDDGAAVDV